MMTMMNIIMILTMTTITMKKREKRISKLNLKQYLQILIKEKEVVAFKKITSLIRRVNHTV